MSSILMNDLTGMGLMLIWAIGTPLISRLFNENGDPDAFVLPSAVSLVMTGIFGVGFMHFFLAVHDTPAAWVALHFFGVLFAVGIIARVSWKIFGRRRVIESAVGETSAA